MRDHIVEVAAEMENSICEGGQFSSAEDRRHLREYIEANLITFAMNVAAWIEQWGGHPNPHGSRARMAADLRKELQGDGK